MTEQLTRQEKKAAKEIGKAAQSIFDSLWERVTYQSTDYRVMWANRAVSESTAVASSNPVGSHCYELWLNRDEPCSACPCLRTFESGEPHDAEIRTPDGRTWFVQSCPVRNAKGRLTGAVEFARDITTFRRIEEQYYQIVKTESVGQLTEGIVHDFNNLLTGILGYSNLLRIDADPGSDTYMAAEIIEKAGNRAAGLTGRLLSFVRKSKQEPVPVDMHEIIRETAALLEQTIAKNIKIELHMVAEHFTVIANPDQMEQMVLNLAINARDAMPDGGSLTLETEIASVDERDCHGLGHREISGERLMLRISDTGCGIPEDILKNIFDPFFTTKALMMGTGMGLAIVREILEKYDCTIEVDSLVGQGTTFRICMPLIDDTSSKAIETEAIVCGTGKILVVDDEEIVRHACSAMLKKSGYDVVAVEGGREAMEYYHQHRHEIDLVIIDLDMPKMGGDICFMALQKIDPNVRALLSSGYGMNPKIQEALDEGMLGFVAKPYTIASLSTSVHDALCCLDV